MAQRPEVGGTVTATTLLKKIFRTFHEGDPKWEMLPTRNDHVAQLFFLLTSNTRRGEMDRFFDADYTNATVTIFYKDYNHETIRDRRSSARSSTSPRTRPRRRTCATAWPAVSSASSPRSTRRWSGPTG